MNTNPLEALRDIYRNARKGAPIEPKVLVAAVGACVASGIDVVPALQAFEPMAWVSVRNVCGADAVALAKAAREQGGWKAAIRMASLLGWSQEWAAAMTAHFGPTGTHPSRCDAEGRPTAETLATCPGVAERMQEAAERWERYLAWRERSGGETRWECVVEMRRCAG